MSRFPKTAVANSSLTVLKHNLDRHALDERVFKRVSFLSALSADMLDVHEIYLSVQGESSHSGRLCVFVRLSGCQMRCTYCDTKMAFATGKCLSVDEVFAQIDKLGAKTVELTGGEPLLQEGAYLLMKQLCDAGYRVLVETGGGLDVSDIDPRVHRIIDIKTPSSGESLAMHWGFLSEIRATDEYKFVIGDRQDYDWSCQLLKKNPALLTAEVLFSSVFGKLAPQTLVEWICKDALDIRFQLQAHKYIWDPKKRGV